MCAISTFFEFFLGEIDFVSHNQTPDPNSSFTIPAFSNFFPLPHPPPEGLGRRASPQAEVGEAKRAEEIRVSKQGSVFEVRCSMFDVQYSMFEILYPNAAAMIAAGVHLFSTTILRSLDFSVRYRKVASPSQSQLGQRRCRQVFRLASQPYYLSNT